MIFPGLVWTANSKYYNALRLLFLSCIIICDQPVAATPMLFFTNSVETTAKLNTGY